MVQISTADLFDPFIFVRGLKRAPIRRRLGTETNTFAPFPTSRAGFEAGEFFPPETHPDEPSFSGAPLWAAHRRAEENNWHVTKGLCVIAEPSGITVRSAYESLRDEILEQLKAAMLVDVVALGVHGAMVAEGYDDCEGDPLARVCDYRRPRCRGRRGTRSSLSHQRTDD